MPTQLITSPNIIIKVLYFCKKFTQETQKRTKKSLFKPNNNWIQQTLAGNKLQSNNNGSKERYKITEKVK